MSNAIRKFQRINGGNQPPQPEHVDLLLRGLEVLTIHPGDTVVIRTELDPVSEQVASAIRIQILAFMQSRGVNDINFLLLPKNIDVQSISAEQMKQLGWEKTQRIAIATAVPNGL
jgi:hypothetical protein